MYRRVLLLGLCVLLGMGMLGVADEVRVLRMTEAWPTYIDPAVGRDLSSTIALVNLYDSLVYPDADGSPQPHLATHWEVCDEGLQWTFYLRDDVVFHDGRPLTASDVAGSMDRLLTIGEGYAYLFSGRVVESEVVDTYTVRFHLSEPFGPFLMSLYRLSILNVDLVMDNIEEPGPYGEFGDYGKAFLLTNSAGSGPYMVREFRLEEELITEKNPNYWLPIDPEAPDEFHLIGITETATVRTMMARRELEITDTWQPEENLVAMARVEGVEIAVTPAGTPFVYGVHNRKAPTDCVYFRRAMGWAFDYETAQQELFPGSLPVPGVLPSSQLGAIVIDDYPYYRDVDRALAELQQSVYYDELDDYEVVVAWTAEVPAQERIALMFMSNMADIGINVRIRRTPWMTMVEEAADVDAAPHIQCAFITPAIPEAGVAMLDRFHSGASRSYTQNEWLLDDELDAKIEAALSTVDEQERLEAYADIQLHLAERFPTLNVFEQVRKHAYQEAYLTWPLDDLPSMVFGYPYAARFIQVHPERLAEIVGG